MKKQPTVSVALAAFCLAFLPWTATGQDQETHSSEPPWMLLVYFSMDQKCGILSNQENQDLRAIINFEMSISGIPTDEIKGMWDIAESGELAEDLTCDGQDVRELTSLIRDMIKNMNNLVAETPPVNAKELTGSDAIAGLVEFMDSLPEGQLSRLEGCWRGIVGVWESEFCFGVVGNTVVVSTAPPNLAFSCRLEGEARSDNGTIVLYALPVEPSCQQAGQLSHFSGRCQYVGGRLECQGAFARNAEDTYADDTLETYVAGKFALGLTGEDIILSIQNTFDEQTRDLPRGMLGRAGLCRDTARFFGAKAKLCFDATSDQGRLTISDPHCVLEGEALRMSETFVVASLLPTADCITEKYAIVTAGCSETDELAFDCHFFGLRDGFSFADWVIDDVRVPLVGNATFAGDPLQ